MKLDRNLGIGRGKYALIKLREDPIIGTTDEGNIVMKGSAIDFGDSPETDFFVIRIKDKYAAAALAAYAGAAMRDDPEYAVEILNLAKKAAEHPTPRIPD